MGVSGKGSQNLGKINVSSFEITVQKANMQQTRRKRVLGVISDMDQGNIWMVA